MFFCLIAPAVHAGDVAMFRGNPQHTGSYSTGGIVPSDTMLWRVPVNNPTSDPVVADGVVYVGNLSGTLLASDALTGNPLWQVPVWHDCGGGPAVTGTYTTPVVWNGMVYYHYLAPGSVERITVRNTLDGLSTDGSCGGSRIGDRAANQVLSSPVLDSPERNYTSMGAFDDGIWLGAPSVVSADSVFIANGPVFSSPAFDSGRLFFGDEVGYIYAIDPFHFTNYKPFWKAKIGSRVRSSPAVAGGVVYVGSDSGLFAFNETLGTEIWRHAMSGAVWSSPAVAKGMVYVIDNNGSLAAINTADGITRWTKSLSVYPGVSPTVADGIVYVGTRDGEVYAYDAVTGDQIWMYQGIFNNEKDGVISSIVVDHGTLYFTTSSMYLIALGGSHPHPRSNIVVFGNNRSITSWPSQTDYSRPGGSAAIRRTGEMDAFTPAPYLPGTDWVMVTNGAAIKTDGTLVTWNPGSTTPVWNPCGTKKYVAISQYHDWLLTIYEDSNGQTHLEPVANPASPPEIFKNTPSDTGWKMVAAGNNHALALRSNGTLVSWGDNTHGQLDLPVTTTYHDIEAGDDFSLALDTSGTVFAAGKDDAGQVSGTPAGTGYMTIEAGPATGAALTKNGTIVLWGRTLAGSQPPSDAGYTDLALMDGYGFALQENVKEAAVTEPLSPGRSVKARDGSIVDIPFGSGFDHTHNDVMRIFAPNGTQILWANDENATQVRFPAGAVVPIPVLHYVPSGSRVDGTADYIATVNTAVGVGGDVMTVTEDAWYDEQDPSRPQTLPRAVCFADTGCSVGVTTKQQLFLSDPPMPVNTGEIPVFSVHQLSDTAWVGTISSLDPVTLAPTGPENTRTMIMEKNRVDPDQQINLSIISSDWGSGDGVNMWMTAKADITGGDSALHYTITGTSSVAVPSVSVIPRIYKQTPAGDVLVFTGDPQTCPSGKSCTVEGDFVPVWDVSNITSMFFANTTVVFTLPSTGVGAGGLERVGLQPPETDTAPTVPEVVVTGPLSPIPPGTTVREENANNTVPWGGTIEHVMNGDVPTTIVYDAGGLPLHRADDRASIVLSVPRGNSSRGTWIHEIPDGSDVTIDETQSVIKYKGELGYTENYTDIVYRDAMRFPDPSVQGKNVDENAEFGGYLEIAKANRDGYPEDRNELNHLSGYWHVPTAPLYPGLNKPVFLFNAVQGPNRTPGATNNVIVQPVLEYNLADTGKYWTIAPWVCGMPCVHTTRLSVSSGDEILGQMHYLERDNEHNSPFWQVAISKGNSISERKVNTTTQIDNKTLLIVVGALEAYNQTTLSSLPGNTRFYETTYLDQNYNAVPVSVNGVIPDQVPSWIRTKLRIDVENIHAVTLRTDQ